jgi:hypothetical protein
MKIRNSQFLVKSLVVLGLTLSLHAFAAEKAGEGGAEKEKAASSHESHDSHETHETHEATDAPHEEAGAAAESHDQAGESNGNGANDGGTLRPGMHENADVPVKPIPTSQVPKN